MTATNSLPKTISVTCTVCEWKASRTLHLDGMGAINAEKTCKAACPKCGAATRITEKAAAAFRKNFPTVEQEKSDDAERQYISTNQDRAEYGLPPMTRDDVNAIIETRETRNAAAQEIIADATAQADEMTATQTREETAEKFGAEIMGTPALDALTAHSDTMSDLPSAPDGEENAAAIEAAADSEFWASMAEEAGLDVSPLSAQQAAAEFAAPQGRKYYVMNAENIVLGDVFATNPEQALSEGLQNYETAARVETEEESFERELAEMEAAKTAPAASLVAELPAASPATEPKADDAANVTLEPAKAKRVKKDAVPVSRPEDFDMEPTPFMLAYADKNKDTLAMTAPEMLALMQKNRWTISEAAAVSGAKIPYLSSLRTYGTKDKAVADKWLSFFSALAPSALTAVAS